MDYIAFRTMQSLSAYKLDKDGMQLSKATLQREILRSAKIVTKYKHGYCIALRNKCLVAYDGDKTRMSLI